MRKIFAIILLMMIVPVFAGAVVIEKISGNCNTPEKAHDGDINTSAIFKNSPGKDYTDIFIYLDDEAYPEEVTMLLTEDVKSISLAVSMDIVNWMEAAMLVQKYDEQNGGKRVVMTVLERVSGKYLRVRLSGGEEGVVEVKEIQSVFGEEQPNAVSDVVVNPVNDYSVEITYKTEHPAKTHIRYGAQGPVFDNVYMMREHLVEHRAELKNLFAGTDYFYQIVVGSDEEAGEVHQFKTTGEPLPQVKKVYVKQPTSDSVSVDLEANKPVKWKVLWNRYDKELPSVVDESNSMVQELKEPVVEASVSIENLVPRKKYYLQVQVEDVFGKKAVSDLLGFQAAEKNLATGSKVSGTFTNEKMDDKYIQKSNNPVGRVTDGDEAYHTGFAKSQKPTKAMQWVRVDLGNKKRIGEVVIVWSDLAVPVDYTVSTSLNDADKKIILNVKDGKYPEGIKVRERQSPRGDPLLEVRINADEDIRYIQLNIPKNTKIRSRFDWDYAMLAEIKALEPEQE